MGRRKTWLLQTFFFGLAMNEINKTLNIGKQFKLKKHRGIDWIEIT